MYGTHRALQRNTVPLCQQAWCVCELPALTASARWYHNDWFLRLATRTATTTHGVACRTLKFKNANHAMRLQWRLHNIKRQLPQAQTNGAGCEAPVWQRHKR